MPSSKNKSADTKDSSADKKINPSLSIGDSVRLEDHPTLCVKPSIPSDLRLPPDLDETFTDTLNNLSDAHFPHRSIIAMHTNEIDHVNTTSADGFAETQHQVELWRAAMTTQDRPLGVQPYEDGHLPPFVIIANFNGERYIFYSKTKHAMSSLIIMSMVLQIGPSRCQEMHKTLARFVDILHESRKQFESSSKEDVCLTLFYSLPKFMDSNQSRYWELRFMSRSANPAVNTTKQPPSPSPSATTTKKQLKLYDLCEYGVCANSNDAGFPNNFQMGSAFNSSTHEFYNDHMLQLASKAYTVYDLEVRIRNDAVTFNQVEQMRLKLVILQKLLHDGLCDRDKKIAEAESKLKQAVLTVNEHAKAVECKQVELERSTSAESKLQVLNDKLSTQLNSAKREITLAYQKTYDERRRIDKIAQEKTHFAEALCKKDEELGQLQTEVSILKEQVSTQDIELARSNEENLQWQQKYQELCKMHEEMNRSYFECISRLEHEQRSLATEVQTLEDKIQEDADDCLIVGEEIATVSVPSIRESPVLTDEDTTNAPPTPLSHASSSEEHNPGRRYRNRKSRQNSLTNSNCSITPPPVECTTVANPATNKTTLQNTTTTTHKSSPAVCSNQLPTTTTTTSSQSTYEQAISIMQHRLQVLESAVSCTGINVPMASMPQHYGSQFPFAGNYDQQQSYYAPVLRSNNHYSYHQPQPSPPSNMTWYPPYNNY